MEFNETFKINIYCVQTIISNITSTGNKLERGSWRHSIPQGVKVTSSITGTIAHSDINGD